MIRDYVANESIGGGDVYFDDLRLEHVQGHVRESTDYYPFGGVLRRSRQEGHVPYRYGYQGDYAEQDPGTVRNSFELREYDSRIGRFTTVDPYGQFWGPYMAMGNDPVNNVDPDGGFAGPGPGFLGKLFGYNIATAANGLLGRVPGLLSGIGKFALPVISGIGNSLNDGDVPTIFVNLSVTPEGFDRNRYFTLLKSNLVANGFNSNLSIEESSIYGNFKAWWNGSPTATVTIKNFQLGRDSYGAGGYAELNNPHSIIIYNELTMRTTGRKVPLWKYVNATIHEVGHGLFGFNHDSKGKTKDPLSIMDYRSAYNKGAGFNAEQRAIIKKSIWGR